MRKIWTRISTAKKLVAVVILAIAFAFYWYEYRPSQARKECAELTSVKRPPGNVAWERIYNACLKSKGL